MNSAMLLLFGDLLSSDVIPHSDKRLENQWALIADIVPKNAQEIVNFLR